MCPQRFRKVPFSAVQTYARKQRSQKFYSRERFEKVPFSLIVFIRYVWTEVVSVKKKLRFQLEADTCRQGLSSPFLP